MPKPVLAIDVDEVLFPLVPELVEYHSVEYGSGLTAEDFTTYEFERAWPGEEHIPDRVFKFLEGQFPYIDPVPGAQAALQRLAYDYELMIVTARDPELEAATAKWLAEHFPEVFGKVVLAGNHFRGGLFRTKVEICLEHQATALIDDSAFNVSECAAVGIQGILFGDYPWNREAKLPVGVVRAGNWEQVANLLTGGEYGR